MPTMQTTTFRLFNSLKSTLAQVDRETLVAFDQHVPIEDDTDEWEKNLIESHLAETPTENTSDFFKV
jgi:hypothetical protein